MPVTVGNDQIIDMEPTRYYQTLGIPIKGKGEIPPSHKYLDSSTLANLTIVKLASVLESKYLWDGGISPLPLIGIPKVW